MKQISFGLFFKFLHTKFVLKIPQSSCHPQLETTKVTFKKHLNGEKNMFVKHKNIASP